MSRLIQILLSEIEPHERCACDNCEWTGSAIQVTECTDALLTPGHEVPAGRCPECQALVYIVIQQETT